MSEFDINKPFERRDGIAVDWWHHFYSDAHDATCIIYGYVDNAGLAKYETATLDGRRSIHGTTLADLINTPVFEYRAEWVSAHNRDAVLKTGWNSEFSLVKEWLADSSYPRGIYRREVGCTDPSRWELVES